VAADAGRTMAAETERGLRDIAVNTACLPDSMPAASLRIMTPRYDRPCRKRDGGRADECDVWSLAVNVKRKRPAPPGVGPVAKARFRQRGGRKPDACLD